MTSNNSVIIKSTQVLFVIVVLCCIAFFFSRYSNDQGFDINVSSNIKDLSPKLTSDLELAIAVDHIATSIENRFTLLLLSEKSDLEPAGDEILAALSAYNGINASVGGVSADLIKLLAPYRFNFLSDSQRLVLSQSSQSDLIDEATARLFNLGSSQGLLSLEQDPLGWFTDYVVSKSSALANPSPDTSEGLRHLVIDVSLDRGSMDLDIQKELIHNINEIEGQIIREYPDIKILHSGVLFIAADTARQARRDIERISIISVIAVITILLLAFHSLKPLLLSTISILVGVIFAFVVTHFLYDSVHVLTIVFGASLIGVIIDYSLHYFYHQSSSDQRISGRLINAMCLSLLSSIIGYGALGLSDLISLQKVAVFSCAGLIAAWVTVIALAIKLNPRKTKINPKFLPPLVKYFSKVIRSLAHWNKLYLIFVFIIAVVLCVNGVKENDHPSAYFKFSKQLLAEEIEVAEHTQLFEPGRYFVVRGDDVDSLYENLDALYTKAPNAHLISILDFLPSLKTQRENYQLQGKLYSSSGAAADFMSGLGIEQSIINALLQTYKNSDNQLLLPSALFAQQNSQLPPLFFEHGSVFYSFVLIAKSIQPSDFNFTSIDIAGVDYFDTAAMSTSELRRQRLSALQLLMVAFALIAIVSLIRYRTFSALWMLSIPISATLITLFALSSFGSGLTLFHTMALFLVLGLGMDYVIFVSELDQNRSITLQAVFLSAVTSLLSFGLLSASSMPMVSAFGSAILIGNSVNLVGAMLYAYRRKTI